MKRIRNLLLAALLVPAFVVGTLAISFVPALTQNVQARSISIDVNTASTAQLQVLPGVGPTAAAAIIKARPFKDMNDFRARVKGLSAANLEKIEEMVAFSTPTPSNATADGTDAKIAALKKSGKIINVNAASAADLQLLPHVGTKTSAEIIKNRPFKDLADLQKKVKGIGEKTATDIAPFISFK